MLLGREIRLPPPARRQYDPGEPLPGGRSQEEAGQERTDRLVWVTPVLPSTPLPVLLLSRGRVPGYTPGLMIYCCARYEIDFSRFFVICRLPPLTSH